LGVLHPNLFLSKAGETLPAFCVYLRWLIQKPAVCFTGYDTPPIASLEEICKKAPASCQGFVKRLSDFCMNEPPGVLTGWLEYLEVNVESPNG
jgi:hypothetical protein